MRVIENGLVAYYYKQEIENQSMETLAICNPIIRDIYPNNLYYNFILCGENINIGLLDIEVKNEERLTEYAVSVQVNAFSCNYRDKAIMHEFNDRCNMLSKNSRYFYSPFGIRFCSHSFEYW